MNSSTTMVYPNKLKQQKLSCQVILKTLRPCQFTKMYIMFPLVYSTKKQIKKYRIKTPTIKLRFLLQVKQLYTWWNKKQLSQLRNCDGMISLYLKFLQASLRRLKILRLPKVCTFFLFFCWFTTSMIVVYCGINDKCWTNRRPWWIEKVEHYDIYVKASLIRLHSLIQKIYIFGTMLV